MAGGTGTGWEVGGGGGGGHGGGHHGGTGTGWEVGGGGGGGYVYPNTGHHGGGGIFGFLHSVGHWLGHAAHWAGSKFELAGHDLDAMPGGMFTAAKEIQPQNFFGDVFSGNLHGAANDVRNVKNLFEGQTVGSYDVLKHPLRDPFQTLMIAAPGLDVAGRFGEAGLAASEAARSGEGGLEAARAAGRALGNHTPLPREIHVPGNEDPVFLHASRNAGVRLIQRAYDHVLQRALNKSSELEAGRFSDRVAAHAMRRAGGAALSASRITTRMREATPFLLGKAAKQLSKLKLGDGTYKPEDIGDGALGLVLENATPAEAAVAHRAWAEGGLAPAENKAWADFYSHLDRLNLLRRDPATGKVEINPEVSPELAHIAEFVKTASRENENAVTGSGLMSEEGAAARRNAPNLVRAGVHIPGTMQRALRLAVEQRDALANALETAQKLDEDFQFNQGPKTVDGYRVAQGPYLTPGGKSVEGEGFLPLESPLRDRILRLRFQLEDAENRVQKIAERAAKGSQKPEPIQRAVLREIAKEVHGGDAIAANQELALVDRAARQWAIEHDATPAQFYQQYVPEVIRGIPGENADLLAQVKPFDEQAATEAARQILRETPKDKEGTLAHRQTLPPGAKTVKGLVKLMRELHGRASAAEFARLWYELRGRGFRDVSPSAEAADRFGQLESIFSPRKDVQGSTGAAIEALNEHAVRGEVTKGFGHQKVAANELLNEGKPFTSSGPKTPSYRMNSLEEIDPELYRQAGGTGQEVTNDTWMRRAFGYERGPKGEEPVTDKQYEFMSKVERHLADQLGWKPKNVQAAIWTHIKAEMENGHAPTVEELRQAMQNPTDFFGKHSAQVYFEAEHPMLPPESRDWSPAKREEYLHAKLDSIYDENGRNLILEALGLYGYRGSEGFGEWEGATTPSAGTRVLSTRISTEQAGVDLPHQRPYQIEPNARQLIEEAAAAHGYVFNQDAVGYGQAFGGTALTRQAANAVYIERALTPEEIRALRANGLTGDALILHAPGDRTIFVNMPGEGNPAFQDHVAQVVDATLGPTHTQWIAHDGGLVERGDYASKLESAIRRRPDLRRALDALRERSSLVDRRFTQEEEARASGEHPVGAAGRGRGRVGEPDRSPDRLSLLHQEYEEPPRSAGEVAMRGMTSRGVKLLGAYDRESHRMYIGHEAQPGTILHEALHAILESASPEIKQAVMRHYGEGELTPDLHERFVEDMSNRYTHGTPLPPELERVYQAIQHQPAEGVGYVPGYTSDEAGGTAPGPSGSYGSKVGGARSPIRSAEYRGEAMMHGARGLRTVNMIAAHIRRINKYLETTALRQVATRSVGTAVRQSERQVLVRDLSQEIGAPGSTPKVSADVEQLLGRRVKFQTMPVQQAVDTEAGALAGLQGFVQELFPGIEDKNAYKGVGIGTEAPPGYKWVDRGALPNVSRVFKSADEGRLTRYMDAVNSAVTAATVYFKLGHIYTRLFTNLATNLLQGSVTPLGIARSVDLWHQLTTLDRWRAYGAVGTNYYEALPAEGETAAARIARGGARFFGHWVDVPFRFNSLAYEFRRIGVNTADEFRHALDVVEGKVDAEPAERAKYIQAMERADREAIAYDRMNDFEKRFLSRAIWFYPWVKGSSVFTMRTIFEHPYKAALLGGAARLGIEQQQKDFPGGLPTYEYGLIKLMGGQNPLVIDLSTFSPFATLGGLMTSAEHPMEISGNLNPTLSGLQTLITQRTPTGVGTNSPLAQALLEMVSATPEAQIAEQLGGHSGKMFPAHPAYPVDFPGAQAFWRMLFGPAMPRRTNPAQLAKDFGLEKAGPR